jgi:hypothetical protein
MSLSTTSGPGAVRVSNKKLLVVIVLGLAWFLIPVMCAFANGFVRAHWVIQESPRFYYAYAIAGALWLALAIVPLLVSGVRLGFRDVALLTGISALAGAILGTIGLNLINCIRDNGPNQAMEFEQVLATLKGGVRFRAVRDPIAGMTFEFSVNKVPSIARRPINIAHVRYLGRIRRGRLGLWWVEFLDRDDTTRPAAPAP